MTRLTALVGIVSISFSAIFVRLADVAPTTAAFFRAAYAVPLLYLVRRFVGDERGRRERLLSFGAGAMLAIDMVMWHAAIGHVGAGMATVVANTQVLWVGLVAWIIYKERPTSVAFATIPLVLVGIALIGGIGSADAYGSNPALGALLALGASVMYTAFILMLRASNRGLGPAAGPLLDATAGAAAFALIIGAFDSSFSFIPTWPAHGWLIAVAVVAQVLGWLFISQALPRLPALDTSVMLLLQPALTILWAWMLFVEALAPLQWIGVGLVLGGILATSLLGAVRKPDPHTGVTVPKG